MSKEEIVERLDQIKHEAEHLEAERIEISALLMEMMKDKEELIGDFIVSKVTVIKAKPELEQARELGATIIEEKIDAKKIKKLMQAGVKFPTEEFTYLKLRREE